MVVPRIDPCSTRSVMGSKVEWLLFILTNNGMLKRNEAMVSIRYNLCVDSFEFI